MVELKVIKGGRCLDEDLGPNADKPVEEWTPEDHEAQNEWYWETGEPGEISYIIRHLPASPEDIRTTVRVMDLIRRMCDEEAERKGYRCDFDLESCPNLLWYLKRRQKADEQSPEE